MAGLIRSLLQLINNIWEAVKKVALEKADARKAKSHDKINRDDAAGR